MSRPRNRSNASLPDNLYRKDDKRVNKTYYTYRDPRNGKVHGLGTNKESAENDARALNAAIYSSIRSVRLVVVTNPKPDSPKFCTVLERHLLLCEKRKLADNTMRSKKCLVNAWRVALGSDTPIGDITIRNIVEIINSYIDRPRMAQAMRSAAIDIWKDAMEEGWVQDNTPLKTRGLSVEVKRSRLTMNDYNLIHAAALRLNGSSEQWS